MENQRKVPTGGDSYVTFPGIPNAFTRSPLCLQGEVFNCMRQSETSKRAHPVCINYPEVYYSVATNLHNAHVRKTFKVRWLQRHFVHDRNHVILSTRLLCSGREQPKPKSGPLFSSLFKQKFSLILREQFILFYMK